MNVLVTTTHVQPDGSVVISRTLDDGRVIRVCGQKPYRGCSIADELDKWIRWEEGKKDGIHD